MGRTHACEYSCFYRFGVRTISKADCQPLGDASLSSLVDARQCIPAERMSVDGRLSTLMVLFIAALFLGVSLLCLSNAALFCFYGSLCILVSHFGD